MQTSPSQQSDPFKAGFSFLHTFGDKKGTELMKTYKPATIRRSKDKWYVEYAYRNPGSGKFDRIKVYENINRMKGEDREAYAEQLRKAVDHALKLGFNPFEADKDPLTVAVKNWSLIEGLNYFKQNLPNRGLRHRSVQSYQSVLRMLYKELDAVKNAGIKAITRQHVSAALSTAKHKNSWNNTTYNNNLTFTKAIFNYLINEEAGILDTSPAAKIKPLPQTIVGNQAWTDKEFELIREKADPELLRFIMFIYYTGIRPASAVKMHSDHILEDGNDQIVIRGDMVKSKRVHRVPVTKEFIAEYKTGDKLFKYSKNHYTKKFQTLREDLELSDNIKLYSVKHTRAVHLVQAGASPYVIMDLFGHHSLEVTMSYMRDAGLGLNREATIKGMRF